MSNVAARARRKPCSSFASGNAPSAISQTSRSTPGGLSVVLGLQQVEVECLAQPGGAGVEGAPLRRRIRFGHCGPRRGVLVKNLPPLGVDLMDLVPVMQRVASVKRYVGVLEPRLAAQRLGEIFGQSVGHIDAVAVDAAVGPESQRGEEVVAYLAVVPVEVGLLTREQMAIPLPVGHPGRRSAEVGDPVRRWLRALRAGT